MPALILFLLITFGILYIAAIMGAHGSDVKNRFAKFLLSLPISAVIGLFISVVLMFMMGAIATTHRYTDSQIASEFLFFWIITTTIVSGLFTFGE